MSIEKPKPYVSRLVVKLGKQGGPEYSVEITFPVVPTSEEFEKARKAALHDIQEWLKEKEPVGIAEVERLPWKDYKTKEPVGAGHTGWIMWEKDGGGQLAKAIEEEPEKKLKLGPYELVFSGDKKQFIGRRVVEPIEPAPTPNGAPQQ
jgi:hypothetical protein